MNLNTPSRRNNEIIQDTEINRNNQIDYIKNEIYEAAKETALSHYESSDEFKTKLNLFRCCQQWTNTTEINFRNILNQDTRLINCRAANLGNLAPDGFTPLHVASSFNNVKALEILLHEYQANAWIRDLRGRTALHLAAENSCSESCRLLRKYMKYQRQIDPIGISAPTDLAGTTPLGSACQKNQKRREMIPIEIEHLLFTPGDNSIFPKTPTSIRVGQSSWKKSTVKRLSYEDISSNHSDVTEVHDNGDIFYAFSEAQGWSAKMEDRTLVASPVSSKYSHWHIFAVFDGHGGDLCSQYLSTNFIRVLIETADENGLTMNEGEYSESEINHLLLQSCQNIENELKHLEKLKVTKHGRKYKSQDNSGSTGVICLVTNKYIAVANVGDSRAVLAVNTAHNDTSLLGTNQRDQVQLKCVPLSYDHKFNIQSECDRAFAANARVRVVQRGINTEETNAEDVEPPTGLIVEPNQAYEVLVKSCDSKLRMSRSFGDFLFKMNEDVQPHLQAVIAVPEIIIRERTRSDAFIAIACDGIWDVMSNQDVCDLLGNKLSQYTELDTNVVVDTCDYLLTETLHRRSQDNLSAILVVFDYSNNGLSSLGDSQLDQLVSTDAALSPKVGSSKGCKFDQVNNGSELMDDNLDDISSSVEVNIDETNIMLSEMNINEDIEVKEKL